MQYTINSLMKKHGGSCLTKSIQTSGSGHQQNVHCQISNSISYYMILYHIVTFDVTLLLLCIGLITHNTKCIRTCKGAVLLHAMAYMKTGFADKGDPCRWHWIHCLVWNPSWIWYDFEEKHLQNHPKSSKIMIVHDEYDVYHPKTLFKVICIITKRGKHQKMKRYFEKRKEHYLIFFEAETLHAQIFRCPGLVFDVKT